MLFRREEGNCDRQYETVEETVKNEVPLRKSFPDFSFGTNAVSKAKLMTGMAHSLLAVIGGMTGAMAFAPGNFPPATLLGIAILVVLAAGSGIRGAAWYGWLWGTGLNVCSFFWLREIHPIIPFPLGMLLAIPYAVLSGFVPVLALNKTGMSTWRQILCTAGLAGGYVLICEYSRSAILPWNYLSSTLWRVPVLLGLLPFAGPFLLSFLLAMLGIGVGLALVWRKIFFLLPMSVLIVSAFAAGELFRSSFPAEQISEYRFALIQGDISQRRNADRREADEALDTYLKLSRNSLSQKADFTIWPETAVPYAIYGPGPFSGRYRRELRQLISDSRRKFLIGSLDYRAESDTTVSSVNSAMLFDRSGTLTGTYNKMHLVPFGEYIPFRRFLPASLIQRIDMGRDLTSGNNSAPLAFESNNLRAGMMICFEDVFPGIPRESVRRGANILLTITNDAWFPLSSEPEQHLANVVMRAVENNLYFIRVGNNGGSCVIDPTGRIGQVLQVPGSGPEEIRRGRGWNVVKVYAPNVPRLTFYAKTGDWIIWFCAAIFLVAIIILKRTNGKDHKKVLHDQEHT